MFRRSLFLRCSSSVSDQASSSIMFQAAVWRPNWYPADENFENVEIGGVDDQLIISENHQKEKEPFTIMSYNILAQRFANPKKFPHLRRPNLLGQCRYSVDHVKSRDYRLNLIADQIAETQPDIVLLQEVAASMIQKKNKSVTAEEKDDKEEGTADVKNKNEDDSSSIDPSKNEETHQHHHDERSNMRTSSTVITDLNHNLTGFEAMHFPNTTKEGDDEWNPNFDLEGIGMLWNPERFELESVERVKFNPHFRWILSGEEANMRCLNQNNICSLATFIDKNFGTRNNITAANSCPIMGKGRKKLIVAGMHLDYRRGHDFQLVQIKYVIDLIRRREGFEKTCPMCKDVDSDTAVVLMGDMNMDGCSDEMFEKFCWNASDLLPDLTRVEFNSSQSEEKMAEFNGKKKNSTSSSSLLSDQKQSATPSEYNNGTEMNGVGDVMKYPFASALMNKYSCGMWLDHCLFTNKSLNCIQHTGLPCSHTDFPILSDTHPSDHVPIAVRMKWR